MDAEQLAKISQGAGFFAALDQSGGSTAGALAHYGVPETAYSDEAQMFDLMHAFRARIMQAPAFGGDRVLGTILFEQTMDRDVAGIPAAEYLWEQKRIVPFVKVDEGLATESAGVQLMKPFTQLETLLSRARRHPIFGTKMRSFVKRGDEDGIAAVLDQQFAYAGRILQEGFVPILEPEVDIRSPEKERAEDLLKAGIVERLSAMPDSQQVILKLSIPSRDDFYAELIAHPGVMRVVALSGGYSQQDADTRLARNHGLIASFSRALAEGLNAGQSDEEFDHVLAASIAAIYAASTT